MPDVPLTELRKNTGWSSKPWYCKYIGQSSRLFSLSDDSDDEDDEDAVVPVSGCDKAHDCTHNDEPESKDQITEIEIP